MTVYLVGAGPGDPGLLTVRGAEVLRRADVVVYDRLASSALLDLAPEGAELIAAGKSPGDLPAAISSAPSGASSSSADDASRSYTTTSARRRSSAPRTVRRPGSPGPAPTR